MSPQNTEARSNADAGNSNANATEQTFEQKVSAVVKQMKQSDEGVWELPDDVKADESVKFAATLEKRRRDTESALGKTRQQLKTEEALRETLEKRAAEQVQMQLTPAEAEELDTLKYDDPEAWRKRVNELERKATDSFQEELSNTRSTVSQQAEIERRTQVLKTFNESHSDAPITDEVLVNDIPPRISKKLEDGKITFEEFLQESYKFLVAPKTTKTEEVKSQPNLGDIGGNDSPTDEALALQDVTDYKNIVF